MRKAVGITVLATVAAAILSGCTADPAKVSGQPSRNQDGTREDFKNAMQDVDDTARIVYAAMVNDVAQVFSVQPDGERSIQLTMDAKYKCRPVWSLDHKQIAFFRYESDRPVGEFVDLMVMNANGSDVRVVKPRLKVDPRATRPSWNLDGKILYVQEKDFPSVLFGYALADGQQTDTVRLPKKTFLTQVNSLSPDSAWIAGSGKDPVSGLLHIGTVRRQDGKDTDLMKPFSKMPLHIGEVVWSYDSQYVAFEVDKFIIVMSSYYRAGFRAKPLMPMDMNAELSAPAFSPSGQYLACITQKTKEGVLGAGDQEVRSDIWVMSVDGKQPHQITDSGTCFDPHW